MKDRMKDILAMEHEGLRAIRVLPPQSFFGRSDTAFMGLTDGPRMVCVPTDASMVEIVSYKMLMIHKKLGHKEAREQTLASPRSQAIVSDGQLVAVKLQPIVILWEILERGTQPFVILPDGSTIPLSTSMAAVLNIVYDVPMAVDGESFDEFSVPLDFPDEWKPQDLFSYYGKLIAGGGGLKDMRFDTNLPPHVAAFFAAIDAPAEGDETDDDDKQPE